LWEFASKDGTLPKLVHRLDRDTSGILVLARTHKAAVFLADCFKEHRIEKSYLAVLAGIPKESRGIIKAPLAKRLEGAGKEKMHHDTKGKYSVTEYEVLDEVMGCACLVLLKPETGRKHQLRVHVTLLGTPIVGDGKYGGRKAFIEGVSNKLHLHAWKIQIPAIEKQKPLKCEAPLPVHMKETMKHLGLSKL